MAKSSYVALYSLSNFLAASSHKLYSGRSILMDYYSIPESIEQQILPTPDLSITALTSFLLPPQHGSNTRPVKHDSDSLFQYFSKDSPTVLAELGLTIQLRNLPTPEGTVIQQLLALKNQAHLAGFQSVRYDHLWCTEETRGSSSTSDDLLFPLWTITFWSRVADVKQVAVRSGTETYLNNQSFGWLRRLGEDLQEHGSTLVTAVHLGELSNMPHWASLAVQKRTVSFGDSFGNKMPEKLHNACSWWLRQHHTGDFTEAKVTFHTLPITTQLDSHSCGILADNTLDHLISGGQHPLLGPSPSDIIAQRLQRFLSVARHIIAQLESSAKNVPNHLSDLPDPENAETTPLAPAEANNDSGSDSEVNFPISIILIRPQHQPASEPEPTPPQVAPAPPTHPLKPAPARQTSITSFWAIATPDKKKEADESKFQRIKENYKVLAAKSKEHEHKKASRIRELA
ncbi:hypothetical protein HYPSUDRAFT_56520 [Hypholoma sublateritium FD-334 SS-4]|uniref:Ubiquitin-like protease family profile domain-containing protein n=1 Tax=Hypholoma sublateritium (strain FD-334 SS-4) TaxID=945553 RepID=A0A0D2KYZ1_HYPSF|nr:hypothetical protein HYPSUDRAFT_56520 [Hypholoma sublateritium FD-334 SS-4]